MIDYVARRRIVKLEESLIEFEKTLTNIKKTVFQNPYPGTVSMVPIKEAIEESVFGSIKIDGRRAIDKDLKDLEQALQSTDYYPVNMSEEDKKNFKPTHISTVFDTVAIEDISKQEKCNEEACMLLENIKFKSPESEIECVELVSGLLLKLKDELYSKEQIYEFGIWYNKMNNIPVPTMISSTDIDEWIQLVKDKSGE